MGVGVGGCGWVWMGVGVLVWDFLQTRDFRGNLKDRISTKN